MKIIKLFICFLLLQAVLVIPASPIMEGTSVSSKFQANAKEKENKIDLAEMWLIKGIDFYKNKEYTAAIDCFRKAVKLSPSKIVYVISLSIAYRKSEKFNEARQLLKESLKRFSGKEDRKKLQIELSNVHSWWADCLRKKNEYADAIRHYKKAYAIDKIYRPKYAAIYLNNIGFLYSASGQKQKALNCFEKALQIMRAVGDRPEEANTLHNIGAVYDDLGQKQKALDYYKKALPLRRTVGDRAREAITLNSIGLVYSDIGQKQKALDYYEKALPLRRAVGDRVGEAATLNNIGLVYSDLGQQQKVLDYYEIGLQIVQAVGDRAGEASTLLNIGALYDALGQKQKALNYYEKALPIMRNIGDHAGEAATLNNIGAVYDALGQKQKALDYYEKALPIMMNVRDHAGEAATLNNIGAVYSAFGQKQKALEYYERVLQIVKTIGDITNEAGTLNNIGVVYSDLGQKQKALEYYEKALPLRKAVGDRAGEATTLSSTGVVYSDLGQYRRALEYYEKALPLRRTVGDRGGEANTLSNIGVVYSDLGQYQRALEYYEKALFFRRAVGDRAGEATTLNNIGGVYSELGQEQKALDYYEKALHIIRTIGYRAGEATTLNNIGRVYDTLGQKQKALDYYQKVLQIIKGTGDRTTEACALSNLMVCWDSLNNSQLSIYYGKQSVNILQKLRTNISGLEREIKQVYLKSKIDTYQYIADFMIKAGRLSEAQHVLDMLKEEEYFNFIRRDRSELPATYTRLDFTKFEKKWLEKYHTVMGNLSNITNEYHSLKIKTSKNDTEKKRMEELGPILEKARKGYYEYLAQLKAAFQKHEKEIKEGKLEPDAIANKASALQETLKYLDENEKNKNASLHYLVFGGRISVIITTPSEQVVTQTEIDEKEFNLLIMNYRNFIFKSGKETRASKHINTSTDTERERNPYAKKLYDVIFRPVDEELKKYGAINLIISLDGVLRYIPFGTLWGGKNYLVQRYRINVITPSSLKNIKSAPVQKRKILGLGASRGGHGFKHLPYVRKEVQAIVNDKEKRYNGLIKGKAFIDHDFTKNTMLKELGKKDYPLVHISSHFKFSPGDETKNFLLLGDGNIIKLNEIRGMGKLFDNVKLLVLSACQTGVGGNGEEIDGFGELAQQSGAKSVVASLWSVEDKSTKDLMVTFYKIMKEGKVTNKIEALRQAQLELAGLEDLLQKTPKQGVRSKTKYSHPYYWGPFILMGNWR